MKKVLITLAVIITLVATFFAGRYYTLATLEVLDERSVQSMGQVHIYD